MRAVRYQYFDYLRFLAIVAVVSIHVNILIGDYPSENQGYWWFANIMDSGVRWCVPIFFMVSGALLLSSSRVEHLRSFLKRRLSRVLIPFFFVVPIYLLWRNRSQLESLHLGQLLVEVIEGPVYYHLWFVYSIVGLYLVTPLIKHFVKQTDQKHILYFLGLWFIISLYGLIGKFTDVHIGFGIPLVVGYVGYFVLGYYLHNFEINQRWLYGIYLLGIAGAVVTAIGTYELTQQNNGMFDDYFYSYFSPNVIIMSIAVYLFIKNLNYNGIKPSSIMNRMVLAINTAVYGIYLIHVLIIQILSEYFHLDMNYKHPYIGMPLMIIIVMAMSYVLTKIGQMIIRLFTTQKSN